ncbi:hypothetical protein C8J57DRAFT_1535039 [Mycena rebaudengoi]|nr:hypothetical protein C8J57DRAFT_1535039 [Mycena rebaudengoi]
MAEWFVDHMGYNGDGDELQWNFLFCELATLFNVMVTHPKYGELGYNFPGFPTPHGDLRKIGIFPNIKILQQRGLLVRRGEHGCGFGERLARYNPTLLDFNVHRIALPELVVMRPNTPKVEEGEISNPFVLHQVDDSSGDIAMVTIEKEMSRFNTKSNLIETTPTSPILTPKIISAQTIYIDDDNDVGISREDWEMAG